MQMELIDYYTDFIGDHGSARFATLAAIVFQLELFDPRWALIRTFSTGAVVDGRASELIAGGHPLCALSNITFPA